MHHLISYFLINTSDGGDKPRKVQFLELQKLSNVDLDLGLV